MRVLREEERECGAELSCAHRSERRESQELDEMAVLSAMTCVRRHFAFRRVSGPVLPSV